MVLAVAGVTSFEDQVEECVRHLLGVNCKIISHFTLIPMLLT